MEDDQTVERDKQQAEVFDALGHPTRIVILKALSEGSLGFADLKKKTGIQSSGHLQHHINKLGNLIETDDYGRYRLSDQGKDAFLSVGTVETAAGAGKAKRKRRSQKKTAALILIAIVALSSVTFLTVDRIETHKRWAAEMEYAVYFNHAIEDHDIAEADYFLDELRQTDREHSRELSKINTFLMWYRGTDFNATQHFYFRHQLLQISDTLLDAYSSILNYTSVNTETGPSFWYFGPPTPDDALLKEAADLAADATALIDKTCYYVTPTPNN